MAKPASSPAETGETKPNFHITPEQKAQLDWLSSEIGVPNTNEAIRSCINVMVALKRQLQPGPQLFLHTPQGQVRLLIPELEPLPTETWQYLVERPHPWRRQLYIKGRKLLASTVWQDTMATPTPGAFANQMSPEEAADNWDLPLPAIHEVFRYCETHQELLAMEASEERYRLEERRGEAFRRNRYR